jgi:hypothetical protein
MKTNIPADTYMSPYFLAKRFESIRLKYGNDQSLKIAKLKSERELWITAAFILGLSKLTGKSFWIGPNAEDSTPDTYAVSFRSSENEHAKEGQIKEITNIEVFEWEDHSEDSLLDAIRKKVKGKKYPEYFTLLCYVHGRNGEGANVETIFQALKTEEFGFAELWLLSSIQDPINDHTVVRLYPERARIDFVYEKEVAAKRDQEEIIQPSRGFGTGFIPMGPLRIPIP